MGLRLLVAVFCLTAFAASTVIGEFPTRTSDESDCPGAADGCWCKGNFAQCWRPYDKTGIDRFGNLISKLELKDLDNHAVMTYARKLSALREIKVGSGIDLDCSCDVIDELDDHNVTLVNQSDVVMENCRERGWRRKKMTALSLAGRCYLRRISREHGRDVRYQESAKIDDVFKRASARKGARPAGSDTPYRGSKEVESSRHPKSNFFDFFVGPRRSRRSATDTAADSIEDSPQRAGRQKRYNPLVQNPAPRGGQMPMVGGGGGGYAPAAVAGPAQGFRSPIVAESPSRAIAGGAGLPQFTPEAEGQPDISLPEDQSSYSDEEEIINEEVLRKIKAVLGATKIDLPVDINDPYDLGLLLRHLRHHSNLLANIGDPEVRNQVLSAMQEEEEEEEQEVANGGARNEMLSNVNANARPMVGGGVMGGGGGGGGGAQYGAQGMYNAPANNGQSGYAPNQRQPVSQTGTGVGYNAYPRQ